MQHHFPFDSEMLFRKHKSIRRELLSHDLEWLDKRIAILGGSTTSDIRKMLELFLLFHGVKPSFYESEFAQYWQDVMFSNPDLQEFQPDIVIIHTSNRNITRYPVLSDTAPQVGALIDSEMNHFVQMWGKIANDFNCAIVQNNFEYPYYRLMGNKDASDIHGKVNFITRLNLRFYEYAQKHENFYINDINYLSADYGLEKWSDPFYWHMYKYSLALPAVPYLAHNVANIIKSLFGKNKKAFALDLDNTLWGGVIGDDGAENIAIGKETSVGQVFCEFQSYIKEHKDLGVILNVNSKNDYDNAISGLSIPGSILSPVDFVIIKANWEPKSQNLIEIADELALLPESIVFVDDNPAEREIIRQQLSDVAVPELIKPEHYVYAIDRAGYFEVTNLTIDDIKRSEMYKENAKRAELQASFSDYKEYLLSLEMNAEIKIFEPMYMARIAQLTNKTNQFNLTTKRYTQAELEAIARDPEYIALYGKMEDKFGDNGVVAIVIGKMEKDVVNIDLWLMSCRVLKREMEDAMLDEFIRSANAVEAKEIRGYYYPTAKNGMVREFYGSMGFEKLSEDKSGNSVWTMTVEKYIKRCHVITVKKEENTNGQD